MADGTGIEWTDATWNPITGCSVVSPGCTHCYAMRLAGTRLAHHPSRAGLTQDTKAGPVWNGEVRMNMDWMHQPLRWERPRMIFVCAHGDLFHENVPDEWIDRVFAVMGAAPQHTFQVLTKRAERMRAYMARSTSEHAANAMRTNATWAWPLPNVWMGVSAEDQQRANERIPHLMAIPAAVRWVSAEPLLGPINLRAIRVHPLAEIDALRHAQVGLPGMPWPTGLAQIDWVVAGGESGPGARPMHPEWARSLRDQCASAGVAFHFKQWGEWIDAHQAGYSQWRSAGMANGVRMGRVSGFDGRGTPGLDGRAWETRYPFPSPMDPGPVMIRVGKARAGRLLAGREHNGMPGDAP